MCGGVDCAVGVVIINGGVAVVSVGVGIVGCGFALLEIYQESLCVNECVL